jgi:hypothetical protein
MKNLLILAAVIVLSPLVLKAQSADPELDYIKSTYSKEKKMIVEEYMGLDVQQSSKFWPVYGAYESKREKLAVERLKAIEDYVNKADAITAAQADKAATVALTNSVNLSKLNLDTYTKMKAALGAVKAAKFMQLETYLQTAWRGWVQENIPVISDLDKTQKN